MFRTLQKFLIIQVVAIILAIAAGFLLHLLFGGGPDATAEASLIAILFYLSAACLLHTSL